MLRADIARAVRLPTEGQHLGYAAVTRRCLVSFARERLKQNCKQVEVQLHEGYMEAIAPLAVGWKPASRAEGKAEAAIDDRSDAIVDRPVP